MKHPSTMNQRDEQCVADGGAVPLRVVEYAEVEFDAEGFQYPGDAASRVLWQEVKRLAIGYEIHPVVVLDWEFFAFQCGDSEVSYWVHVLRGDAFWSEIRRRYGMAGVPAMKDWPDSKFCVRTYVIWPVSQIGRPMFRNVKRHWWSWHCHLVYTEIDHEVVYG